MRSFSTRRKSPLQGLAKAYAAVKYTFLLLVCMLAVLTGRAQTYSTVAVTGFNADIIANGSSVSASTTADVDGAGWFFYNQTFTQFGTPGIYLPTSGLINSAATTGLSFQLADASGLNSLRLPTTAPSGTLSFVTPQTAGMVYLLVTAGSAPSGTTVDAVVNFSDGSSQSFTNLGISDWYNGSPFAISGIGRTSLTAKEEPAGNPRLYQLALQLTGGNIFKNITGVTVTKTATAGVVQVMAVSVAAPCAVPTAQPTALVLTSSAPSQISGSFTAASPAPSQYLVVRYPAGATPVAPVNSVNYTAGGSLGTGTVVQVGTATTFTVSGLVPNTVLDFYVYSLNNTACIGPVYLATTPLTGTGTSATCGTINGLIPIGPTGTYPTLTAAIAALNAGISGPVVLELQSTYTSTAETFPITFGNNVCVTAANTITVRPAAGATGLVITGSNNGPTIDLNGARFVTIDGRPGGTGTAIQLQVVNTSTSGVAVRFVNDAASNKITYLDLQGVNTIATSSTTPSGVVYFGNGITTGNDNNTVSFCNIHGTASATPVFGISAFGSNTNDAVYNDGNNVSGNNIYDWFSASAISAGIKLDAGNNAWTISSNSLYQTAARTYTTGNTHRGFWITPNTGNIATTASGFTITDNFIGGSAPAAAGTAYTMAGAVTSVFQGMDLSVGVGAPTSVQGNVISNINFTTTSTAAPFFAGINVSNGNANVGTVTGNTIGSATGNGAITISVNSSTGTAWGIRLGGGTATTVNCRNNTIGSLTLNGSATALPNFIGIGAASGTNTNVNITNNLIGSTTTANSINLATAGTGTGSVTGIAITSGPVNSVVTGNTIANLTNNSTATATAQTRGIVVSTGAGVISNNIVRNLSNASAMTSTGASSAVVGIVMNSGSAGGFDVTGNTIHSLAATSTSLTAAIQVTGIVYSGITSAAPSLARNFIHSLELTAANTGATITGIDFVTGTAVVANNMIRLGIRADGTPITTDEVIRGISSNATNGINNIWHNSIYIGGAGVAASTKNSFAFTKTASGGTYDIRNNIFVNNRSNAAGTGKHYALSFATNMTGVTLNSNIYFYSGTGGVFANNGTADVAAYTPGWVASDVQSFNADPLFVDPTGAAASVNLHLQNGTIAEGTGTNVPAVTDDFDGQVRSTLTPVDIGADAGNFGIAGVDVGINALVTPTAGICFGASQSVVVRLRNFSSQTINFATNPVTVTVTATGPASLSYSSNITISSGTLAAGATQNVTLPATIDMTAAGAYTFNASTTAAGDLNGSNNAMAATTITVTAGTTLSGTYNVGVGQGASGGFETLTAAVAAYNSANCLSGNVVFQLMDATYSTGETFPISINDRPNNTATLTIRPAANVNATITGSVANAILRLNGADNVTIDGSNNGSASRNLTIENTNTSTSSSVVWINSVSAANTATNNTVKNIITKGQGLTSTLAGILVSGSAAGSTAEGPNNNTLIQNNQISKSQYGINIAGPVLLQSNIQVVGNAIGSNTASDYIGFIGMQVTNTTGSNFSGNTIFNIITTTINPIGVNISTNVSNSVFDGNTVRSVRYTGTSGYGGKGFNINPGLVNSNLTISNNMVSDMRGDGWSTPLGDAIIGIRVGGNGGSTIIAGGIKLYHNTVNLGSGSFAGSTSGTMSAALYLSATTSNLDVRNNILVTNLVNSAAAGAKTYSIYSAASAGAFAAIDNNDYWVSGTQGVLANIGGADINTLAGIQAGFGGNAASLNLQPVFVSATDLHMDITTNLALDNKGTPVGIATDIDGQARSTTTPDMGADEFDVVTGIDFGAISLSAPGIVPCYGTAETVKVRIRNYSANSHNFALIPVTVTASATGPNPVSFAPVVVNTGTLAAGDSVEVTITNAYDMSALGTYTFNAFTTVAADVNATNNAMTAATRVLSAVAVGTVSTTSGPFCSSGTPTLTLTGSNGNIQWQASTDGGNTWNNVGSGAATYISASPITATTQYRAVVSCNATSLTSNTVTVTVNVPQVLTTTPASRCGPGTLTVSATGAAGSSLVWYAAATGGTPLGTGANFTTPVISTTTTYYVASEFATTPLCASTRTAVVATVNPGPAFDITDNTTICNNTIKALALTTPAGNFNSYQWTPATGLFTDAAATVPYTGGSVTTVYIRTATPGTYTIVAQGVNTGSGCTGIDSVKVTVLPSAVTINATATDICTSGTTTLSLNPSTGYGSAGFQWQQSTGGPYTNIAGATSATYTSPVLTASIAYKVIITDAAGNTCLQPGVNITVNTPSVTATTPASLCGPGSLNLAATGSAGTILKWYTTAAGGVPVGTGTSFNTGSLTSTTTFYVSATSNGAISNLGAVNPDAANLTGKTSAASTTLGMLFDVLNNTTPVTIQSVDIFPTATVGTAFTISVRQGSVNGNILASYSGVTSVTGTAASPVAQTVPVNFTLPAGFDYVMVFTGTAPTAVRNTGATGFPVQLPGEISISNGTNVSGTWNYFYNWRIGKGCESPRVAVTATINTVTAINTQPLSQAVCAGTNITFTVAATGTNLTYQWLLNGTPIAGATGTSYSIPNTSPANNGTYTVTVTGVCGPVTSTAATLSVSPANSWLGAVSSDWNTAANWCGPVPTATTDVLIPAGTPFSPVINGTANVRSLTISSGATVTTTGGTQFNIYGNLTNNGTFNAANGFLYFRGTAAQTTTALTAANVVINGTGGLVLNGNMNVTTLILQNGNITLGTNNLTAGSSVNGSVASHVITNGTGSFISNNIGATPVILPIGPDAASYNPVMIANGQGRNYSAQVSVGINPAIATPGRAVNRTWNVTPSAAVTSDVSVTLQYDNAHGNPSFVPNAPVEVGRHNGTLWLLATPANGVLPLGAPVERQVTVQTQAFGPFVVSSPGGLNYPTAVPPVAEEVTRMVLMPNAVQAQTVLRVVTTRAMNMQFQVIDAAGRTVLSFQKRLLTGTNDLPLNLSNLAKGSYYIGTVNEKGKTGVLKFIKL